MDKFAVIKTGGKQYKVSKGDSLKIEKIKAEKDLEEGQEITFKEILLVDDGKKTTVGKPLVEGAEVKAKIEKIGRTKKIKIIKFKAKSRYTNRKGHRQPFFQVKIESIK